MNKLPLCDIAKAKAKTALIYSALLIYIYFHFSALSIGYLREDFPRLNFAQALTGGELISKILFSNLNGGSLNLFYYFALKSGLTNFQNAILFHVFSFSLVAYTFIRISRPISNGGFGLILGLLWLASPLHLYGIYYPFGMAYILLSTLIFSCLDSWENRKNGRLIFLFLLGLFTSPAFMFFPFLVSYKFIFLTSAQRKLRARDVKLIFIPLIVYFPMKYYTNHFFLIDLTTNRNVFDLLFDFKNAFFLTSTGGIYYDIALWRKLTCLLAIFPFLIAPLLLRKSTINKTKEILIVAAEELGASVIFYLPLFFLRDTINVYTTIAIWFFLFRFISRFSAIMNASEFAWPKPILALNATVLISLFAYFENRTASDFHGYYGEVSKYYYLAGQNLATLSKALPKTTFALENRANEKWTAHQTKLVRESAIFFGADEKQLLFTQSNKKEDRDILTSGTGNRELVSKETKNITFLSFYFNEHEWKLDL